MKSFFWSVLLLVFGCLIFALIFRGVKGNPTPKEISQSISNPIKPYGTTERGRYLLTENLVKKHSFALSREQADGAAPDAGYSNGNWYLLYAPGVSILAVPFYILGAKYDLGQTATFIMTTLFSLGNLFFIYLISKKIFRLPNWASLFASIVFGFGTVGLSYVTSLYQHQVTTFLILSGFFFVYQFKSNTRWSFIWGFLVWLNYALAVLVDYSNVVIAFPIMIYFFISAIKFEKVKEGKLKFGFRFSLILTSVIFIIVTFLHGYHNKVYFGSWTKLSSSLVGYREGVQKSLDKGTIEENQQRFEEISAGKTPTRFFTEFRLGNGLYVLTLAPDKGVFIFNPILLLGILGIFYALRKNNLEISILLFLISLHLFYYSSWGDPWGGWAFGPRYMIPVTAVLAIFSAYSLVETKFKVTSKIITFLLFAFSSAVSFLGAVTTNAIPPKMEALPLKIKYGIPFAFDLITQNKTNSFLYNYYIHDHVTLFQYWLILTIIVSLAAAFTLFILPRFEKEEQQKL